MSILKVKIVVFALAFVSGLWLDGYLRTANGIPDCFCVTLKCRLVAVADNPMVVVEHPVEVAQALWTSTLGE